MPGERRGNASKCVHGALRSTTSSPCRLGRDWKAYPGVEQTPGLNQGKVLPHVPTETKGEGATRREAGRGRRANQEPGEEGRQTEELPIQRIYVRRVMF